MQPLSESAVRTSAAHGVSSDQRVRKLLAYAQAPFEKTVFFDGDTHVRDVQVTMLCVPCVPCVCVRARGVCVCVWHLRT